MALLTTALLLPGLAAGATPPDGTATDLVAAGPPQAPTPRATCAAQLLPEKVPPPDADPCIDVPLLVDEGGDSMSGHLAFDEGFGVVFNGDPLIGTGSTSLAYGGRAVCLAAVAASGCGDIDAVTAGSGLAGGGATGNVGLSIAAAGVTGAMIRDGTVDSVDVNSAQVQRRVIGSCTAGTSMRVIALDGTVTCETDDGQVYTGLSPITVGTSTISLSSTGCLGGEAWLWSGATWNCDDVATQGELNTVQSQLSSSISAGDSQLQGQLSAETTARQNADTNLQNQLSAEAAARQNTDTNLQGQLTTETAARQSADTNLQNQLTTETGARQGADTNLQAQLTAETTARQNADTNLQGQLSAHRTSGDHDDRYARDFHGHDFAVSEAPIVDLYDTGDVTVASVTVSTADECPGGENHQYLVEASGTARPLWSVQQILRSSLSLDTSSMQFDHSFRRSALDVGVVYASVHTMKFYTNVSPGSHTFRLVSDMEASGMAGYIDKPTLSVMHLGWTCL